LDYCEQAVASDQSSVAYRDSRGLARALTGDLCGAALDFRFLVNHYKGKDVKLVKKRTGWIAPLEDGRNPIYEAELEALRNE